MSPANPRRLPFIERGQEAFVKGAWYPVIGYALDGKGGGTVFTDKPHGPCTNLGYRIDYADIEELRAPAKE
jgi:hypothetical protein